MGCDDVQLSAYLDGEMPPEERLSVDNHLKQCSECTHELARLRKADRMVLDIAVPFTLHPRIVHSIRGERRKPMRWRSRALVAAFAMIAVAIVTTVVFAWQMKSKQGPNSPNVPSVAFHNPKEQGRDTTTEPKNTPPMRTAQAPAVEPKFESTIAQFKLSGTVQGSTPQAVILNTQTGKQAVYGVGDTLAPGVQITAISSGKVTLDVNGTPETLLRGSTTAQAFNVAGTWRFTLRTPDEADAIGDIVITQDGPRIMLARTDRADLVLEGTLSGTQATATGVSDTDQVDIQMTFTPDGNHATGQVKVTSTRDQPATVLYAATGERINQDNPQGMLDAKKRAEALRKELAQMYQSLSLYAKEHDWHFPTDVAQLVPDIAKNVDNFKSTNTRIVAYNPTVSAKPPGLPPTPKFVATDTRIAEQLIAYEASLQRLWGGPIPATPAVLTVDYTDPPLKGSVSGTGAVSVSDTAATTGGAAAQAQHVYDAMRASDQNNLKQLGLVIKMFQNEIPQEYIPGGWCTPYPEYLTDPNVLTSPWEPAGTASYELLFPAWSQEDLIALHEQLRGPQDPNNPAAQSLVQSEIPIVMDKTDTPGPIAGRNILFLDGHVAFYRSPDWQTQFKPFLDFAHK